MSADDSQARYQEKLAARRNGTVEVKTYPSSGYVDPAVPIESIADPGARYQAKLAARAAAKKAAAKAAESKVEAKAEAMAEANAKREFAALDEATKPDPKKPAKG